ncbi:hypothetical protein BH11PSE2_BH11PSE2_11910 [soil metagenome]
MINGFRCKDCTDVAYAKRHIDPAHPKDGPYGVNAPKEEHRSDPLAVILSGVLAGLNSKPVDAAKPDQVRDYGAYVDLTA